VRRCYRVTIIPGVSQHDQLNRIIEILGPPPDYMVGQGKNAPKYFTPMKSEFDFNARLLRGSGTKVLTKDLSPTRGRIKYRLKTAEEYASDNKREVPVYRKYLKYNKLDDLILRHRISKQSLTNDDKEQEIQLRKCFLNFMKGLLNQDPWDRWTARQAAQHPFITGEPFTGSFKPPSDPKFKERRTAYLFLTSQQIRTPGNRKASPVEATSISPGASSTSNSNTVSVSSSQNTSTLTSFVSGATASAVTSSKQVSSSSPQFQMLQILRPLRLQTLRCQRQ